jgi:hypothetical protein
VATKGFDCATPLTEKTAVAFKADGMVFVCRYLVPSGWKALTKAEVDLICGVGLQIVSVFETTDIRALGGYAAGLADGATAVRVAEHVGQPEGTVIYFAVDFEATAAQMKTVAEYIRGCAHSTPTFRTGVYGSYAVVEAMRAAGVCSQFWQTRAWSRGRISDHANLYQYDCGPDGLGLIENGIKVDLNEGYGDEGSWNIMSKALQVVQLPAEVANNIIDTYLSKTWFSCDEQRQLAEQEGRAEDEAAWKQLRDWQNTIANELRKASGQELQ